MRVQRTSASLGGALILAAGLSASLAGAKATPKVTVLANHLNAPKHLVASGTSLYVVESGAGGKPGKHNCIVAPSAEGPGKDKFCVGTTGAIARISGKSVKTVAGGLASEIDTKTGEIAGPSGVTVNAKGVQAILYQDDHVDAKGKNSLPEPAHSRFGTLRGPSKLIADIAHFSATHPQNKQEFGGAPGETTYDSDPYDVIPYRGGYLVTDAAANSLLSVSKTGKVTLLARFPTAAESVPAGVFGPNPVTLNAQAVPTAVAVGPDGAVYVSELRGVPSSPGTANIYRIVPGHTPTVWASGLTAVTAIAFDGKNLLATELSTGGLLAAGKAPGALIKISNGGKTVTDTGVKGLNEPTGVAVGPKGVVYVANNGTNTAKASKPGQILEITGI